MQTFLPYSSFEHSARVLDTKRLGKQRVEAMQILNTLLGRKEGWKNHPAVKMWRGCEFTLLQYLGATCDEWKRRGFKNTKMDAHITDLWLALEGTAPATDNEVSWLGNRKFHESHKSNLLRKNPSHYSQFGWEVSDDLPYIWPEGK